MSDLCTPREQDDSLESWRVVKEVLDERGDIGGRLQRYATKLVLWRERERESVNRRNLSKPFVESYISEL